MVLPKGLGWGWLQKNVGVRNQRAHGKEQLLWERNQQEGEASLRAVTRVK